MYMQKKKDIRSKGADLKLRIKEMYKNF